MAQESRASEGAKMAQQDYGTWSLEDLALAYELRQGGCCWKRIAQGLGGDPDELRFTVKNLIRDGLKDRRVSVPDWVIRAASAMRSDGIGWRSICDHLGVDLVSTQNRYYKTAKRMAQLVNAPCG